MVCSFVFFGGARLEEGEGGRGVVSNAGVGVRIPVQVGIFCLSTFSGAGRELYFSPDIPVSTPPSLGQALSQ